jgi:hypothetical protein
MSGDLTHRSVPDQRRRDHAAAWRSSRPLGDPGAARRGAGYVCTVQECKVCGRPIADTDPTLVVGGFPLHEACAHERAAELGHGDEPGPIGEAPVVDRGSAAGR